MDKKELEAKALENRQRFESIKKIDTPALVVKSTKTTAKTSLQSPDERNPKWMRDPTEVTAERRALAKESKKKEKGSE